MKILVTGAGGLVGKEFVRRFSAEHQVLPFTRRELDITETEAVRRTINNLRPTIVINCAVAGIEACEKDFDSASAVNVKGTENLAKAASEIDAEFLHLSTNYVFDGNRPNKDFYTAEDAPAPINLYGESKLAGEKAALAANQKTYIVRTSWVFGKDKANFFSTVPSLLREGKKIQAANDIWASATYVSDLAARVSEIVRLKNYATYHIVNAGFCSRYEFAFESGRILEISAGGLKDLIESVKNSDIQNSAKRPRFTPLRCLESERLGLAPMRSWQTALAEFITEI